MGSVGVYTQGWFPWVGHKSAVGFDSRSNDSVVLGMGFLSQSAAAQNDEVVWDSYYDSVTWKAACVFRKASNKGIAHLQLDGVDQGTIDMYAAATTENQYAEVTGVAVSVAQVKTFKVKMATKNASSSDFHAVLQSLAWIRTGGTPSTPGGTDTPGFTWEHIPWMGVKTEVGVVNRDQVSSALGGGWYRPATAQNNGYHTDAHVDSGTYKHIIIFRDGSDHGIHSIRLDDVEKATHDAFASPGATANIVSEVSAISVSAAGTKKVSNIMASKNASSTDFIGRTQSTKWIRTGA